MADVVDDATRSRMMAGIRGKNTQPELQLRRAMHARGFRYRLHGRALPGRPDLVMARFGAVIFVHGCFWHRHEGCRYASTPSTRPEFWEQKFRANVERDSRNEAALLEAGWRIAIVWECSLKKSVDCVVTDLADWLQRGGAARAEF